MLHVTVIDKHDKGKDKEKDTDKKTAEKVTTEKAGKEVVSINVKTGTSDWLLDKSRINTVDIRWTLSEEPVNTEWTQEWLSSAHS